MQKKKKKCSLRVFLSFLVYAPTNLATVARPHLSSLSKNPELRHTFSLSRHSLTSRRQRSRTADQLTEKNNGPRHARGKEGEREKSIENRRR